jgi:hypothetical protein
MQPMATLGIDLQLWHFMSISCEMLGKLASDCDSRLPDTISTVIRNFVHPVALLSSHRSVVHHTDHQGMMVDRILGPAD